MSAGHRHHYVHNTQVCREVQRLLKQPDIAAYLKRPFRADYSRQIPLTGGSSRDGKTYYVDGDVPQDLREFVVWHERAEKAFREVMGMTYARAHTLATCAERMLVESKGKNWQQYKSEIAKPVRHNEARGSVALPAGFDMGPMRESTDAPTPR